MISPILHRRRLRPREANSQVIEGGARMRTQNSDLILSKPFAACLIFSSDRSPSLQVALNTFHSSACPRGGWDSPHPVVCIFSLICSLQARESLAAPLGRADIWLTAGRGTAHASLWQRMWALCVFIFLFSVDSKTG